MARRALKPFTPLLVALVAVALGFLAIGPSHAGPGGVAPVDGPVPTSTRSAPPSSAVSVAPTGVPSQTAPPEERVSTEPPLGVSTHPADPANRDIDYGPKDCASCMVPPGD